MSEWNDAIDAATAECRRIAELRKQDGLEYASYLHMATLIQENLWKPPPPSSPSPL